MKSMRTAWFAVGCLACGGPLVTLEPGDGEAAAEFAREFSTATCNLSAACSFLPGEDPEVVDAEACAAEESARYLEQFADCGFYQEQASWCLEVLESLTCDDYFTTNWLAACRIDLVWLCADA